MRINHTKSDRVWTQMVRANKICPLWSRAVRAEVHVWLPDRIGVCPYWWQMKTFWSAGQNARQIQPVIGSWCVRNEIRKECIPHAWTCTLTRIQQIQACLPRGFESLCAIVFLSSGVKLHLVRATWLALLRHLWINLAYSLSLNLYKYV